MNESSLGDILYFFLSLILEGAPFILLGAMISGIIDAYLPSKAMDRLLPNSPFLAIAVAGMLGAIFPVCECAIVPVIRRLVAKGLPLGCALAYMLAAPIVNPLTALSTWSAFQVGDPASQQPWIMTSFRLIFGYIIAVAIGTLLSRMSPAKLLQPAVLDSIARGKEEAIAAAAGGTRGPDTDGNRLVQAMRTAQKDFLDVAMYFTIGVLIAAFFKTQIVYRPNLQEGIYAIASNPIIAPLVLMALAFVLSLCSTTDAFVIASDGLFTKAAKMSFLVFGPMMDVKLIFLYSTVLQRKAVLIIFLAVAILTWLLCYGAADYINDGFPKPAAVPAGAGP
jgi:uncharacterized membrane protein YraQ (UPF0718 family)